MSKILYVLLDIPFDFLRRLTIPPSTEDDWDRRYAMVFPPFAVIFFAISTENVKFDEPPHYLWWVLLGCSCIISIIVRFCLYSQRAPNRALLIFALAAFGMSIVWIFWIANVLVDVLSLFGIIFGIRPAYLGITVLAWGNSVGDMMANSAVAKKGFGRMAITGCFAGPMFNLLIGLGLSVLLSQKGNPPDFHHTDPESMLPLIACGCLLFQLGVIIGIAAIKGFSLGKF